MTSARTRALFGSIYPAFEYELVNGHRTGRRRPRQFAQTKRCLAVPPSKRVVEPFV